MTLLTNIFYMRILIWAALIIIYGSACNSSTDHSNSETDSTIIRDLPDSNGANTITAKPSGTPDTPGTQATPQTLDTTIIEKPSTVTSGRNPVIISFGATKKQVLRGQLAGGGTGNTYQFTIDSAYTLTAMLAPDKIGCNVTISQILLPGNKTDGPFGKDMKYKLTTAGTYQVTVGRNNSAGNESCGYSLRLVLE